MGFLFFGKRGDKFKEIRDSFDAVKGDISHISGWIKHLHTKDKHFEEKFEHLMEEILQIKEDIDGIKNPALMLKHPPKQEVFKHKHLFKHKQTGVQSVQTPVQTLQKTPFFNEILSSLSPSERLIVWILLNSDMKLSCENVAALLGKQKNTVRGQINSIKQKGKELISEAIDGNKKRYSISDEVRENLLKSFKKKVKRGKKFV
ncbi:MAG: hypothetical protein JSW08_03305 [archaeon]|nr:MAG: hypothetical protein JSW08_03305 [archaeon]